MGVAEPDVNVGFPITAQPEYPGLRESQKMVQIRLAIAYSKYIVLFCSIPVYPSNNTHVS
jgi:hypothetical protein